MSEKIVEDFASLYKTKLEPKIDQFAQEGTNEIFDQVMNKEN